MICFAKRGGGASLSTLSALIGFAGDAGANCADVRAAVAAAVTALFCGLELGAAAAGVVIGGGVEVVGDVGVIIDICISLKFI